MHIAILEVDYALARKVRDWLLEGAHSCRLYTSAGAFITEAKGENFDLLLLDWELPDSPGIEILEWLRDRMDWHVPVMLITNQVTEEDLVLALNKGADDYLIKPISRSLLLAHISVLERRSQMLAKDLNTLKFGCFTLVQSEKKVLLNGRSVTLTDKEYQLTLMLFTNKGRLLSRSHLLASIWGVNTDVATRTLDTHVSRLRKKLRLVPENGWRLKSVYQQGYRLEAVS